MQMSEMGYGVLKWGIVCGEMGYSVVMANDL